MTWIVGATSLSGAGVLMSDIQVTTSDGREFDILQKAYPLGNYICGGFAGSVKIGFILLDNLKELLQAPAGYEQTMWDPIKIANHWAGIARELFEKAPKEEKKLGACFLMVAASPFPEKRKWPPGWDNKIYMIRFVSPDFTPQIMSQRLKMCSIGSGSKVKDFQRQLRTKQKLGIFDTTLRADFKGSQAWAGERWAEVLGFTLYHMVRMKPQKGISKHFHLITVRRGVITGSHRNYEVCGHNGSVVQEHMPNVATNYDEFVREISRVGAQASMATC